MIAITSNVTFYTVFKIITIIFLKFVNNIYCLHFGLVHSKLNTINYFQKLLDSALESKIVAADDHDFYKRFLDTSVEKLFQILKIAPILDFNQEKQELAKLCSSIPQPDQPVKQLQQKAQQLYEGAYYYFFTAN